MQAGDAELRERDGRGEFEESRETQSRTGGRAQGFWRIRMRSAAKSDRASCAEGFGGAQNRADVTRVLHADEDHDERVAAVKQVFKCELARTEESGDALGSFGGGDGGEKLVGGAEDESGTIEFSEERGQGFFGGGAGEDGFEFEAGANRFGDEANAFEADALAFGSRRLQNRAKQFQPMIFARSDGRALRSARGGRFCR